MKLKKEKIIEYLKKLGWAGFFFFLIKGLAWLAFIYLVKKGVE